MLRPSKPSRFSLIGRIRTAGTSRTRGIVYGIVTRVPLTFHPHDSHFNRANALYLAHASDVAYCRAPAAAARERLKLETIAFHDKITRTRGFLGICATHAVLAFRGSDPVTLPNWVTD